MKTCQSIGESEMLVTQRSCEPPASGQQHGGQIHTRKPVWDGA